MKLKKIIAILIMTLFVGTTVLPVMGTINENVNRENLISSYIPLSMPAYLKVEGINGESKISAGVRITITNIGDHMMQDIEWTFDAEGGTIIFGDGVTGRIPVLDTGEEISIILRPVPVIFQDADGQSPLGFGSITLMATAKTSSDTMEATKDTFLIGPFLLFL